MIIAIVLVFSIIVCQINFVTSFATSIEMNKHNGGEVTLSKGASPIGSDEWMVTLTIDGNQLYKKSDIVLVLDSSGSMGEKNKMKEAKKSAIEFIDYLLKENQSTRIAVVTFGNESKMVIGFCDYTNIKKIKNAIQNIKADGGTHMQAGIYEAEKLLIDSDADLKTIVLLGDGEPNFSYKVTSASGISISNCIFTGGIHSSIVKELNPCITEVDTNTTVGKAGEFYLSLDEKLAIACAHDFMIYSSFPSDHGSATIYEAEKAISNNINIYSIAYGKNSDIYRILEQCQNLGYYKIDDLVTIKLDNVFHDIIGKILSSTVNGTVEDVIDDNFNLNSSNINTSQGFAEFNPKEKRISWKTGEIGKQDSATMTYKITKNPNSNFLKNKWYPTSKKAAFLYYYSNGLKGEGNFPVSMISIEEDYLTEDVMPELYKDDHFAYINGYPDGFVRPLSTITREEVAVIFYRLMKDKCKKVYDTEIHNFNDVYRTRWSNKEIATLANAKIVTGYKDGTFRPDYPITRAEFAAITAKFDELTVSNENQFSDISNHWAKNYINSSALKGWINGYADGSFKPNNNIIRCEAMKLINEVLDRRVNKAGLINEGVCWFDNPCDKWYYEIVQEATVSHEYVRESKPKSIEKWTKIK